jgi:hypothetical protein
VHLNDREPDLADRRGQWTRGAHIASRIDQRGVDVAIVRVVQGVDHLTLDVRLAELHVDAQVGRVAPDRGVQLLERHRAKDLHVHLAAHVHARTLNDQHLHAHTLMQRRHERCSVT